MGKVVAAPQTVVLTRQPAQSGVLEQQLTAAGFRVLYLPLTDFQLPDAAGREQLKNSLQALAAGQYQWLVLTSPNGVRAIVRSGWNGQLPEQTGVAVTGPGTSRVLHDEGGYASAPWMPTGTASAASMIEQFPHPPNTIGAEHETPRVLLAQSAIASDRLKTGLGDAGWKVDRMDAYTTVDYPANPELRLLPPAHNAEGLAVSESTATSGNASQDTVVKLEELAELLPTLTSGHPGPSLVLTSPSAARAFARRTSNTGGPWQNPDIPLQLIALGEPTEAQCQASGIELNATCETPDAPGIINAVNGKMAS